MPQTMRYNKPITWPFYFLYKIFNYVCYCFRVKSLVIGQNKKGKSREHSDHFDLLQAYGLQRREKNEIAVLGPP